jgi:hypothetical protein
MTYRVYINSKLTDATVKQIRQELNSPTERAKIKWGNNISNRAIVTTEPTIDIKFNNETIFSGVLGEISYGQKELDIVVYDIVYNALMKKVINNNYSEQTPSTILTAIASAGGVIGSTSETGSLSVRFNNTICFDAIEWEGQATNTGYYSSGGTTINIGDRGSDKGTVPILSFSRRAISYYEKRDKVIIRGVDENGADITETAGAGTDVATFTEKKTSNREALANMAAYRLAQLNKDSSGIKLRIDIAYAYNLVPGDTITIDNEGLNLSGTYKIWRITKKVTDADVEVDVPEELLQRVLDKQRQLEDVGIFVTPAQSLDNPVGAPAAPGAPTTENILNGIKLTWTPNTEADLDYYEIYRHTSNNSGASSKIGEARTTYFVDAEPPAYDNYYFYWLKAADRVANLSGFGTVGSGFARKTDTADIEDGAIDSLQLAASAVAHNHLQIDAVWGSVISAAAITREKLLNDVVTSGVIAPSTVIANNILAGAITTEKLDAYAVTAGKIAASSILAGKIGANAIIAENITADAIISSKIAASAVTANHISAAAITAEKIEAGAIFLGLSTENLQLHFPFEDDQTGTYAFDFSMNNISGALSGAGWAAGRYGAGVDFLVTTDKIDLDSTISLTGAFTIAGWFYITNYATNPGICGDQTSFNNGRIAFNINAQSLEIYANGPVNTDINIDDTFPTNSWFHMVITRDGSGNFLVYLNGVDVTSAGNGTLSATIPVNRVGDNPDDSSWTSLDGYLDEFKIWTRELTPADVTSLYRLGATPNTFTRITEGMIEADAIKGRHIDADVITASHIFAGTITKTETDGTIALTDGTRAITVYPTGSLGGDQAAMAGKHVKLNSDDIIYFSDGVNWVPTDVSKAWDSSYASERKVTHGPNYSALSRYYFHGVDGDATFSSDGVFPRAIMYYENLTVNSGITVSAKEAPQYVFVAASLNLINNAAIVGATGALGGVGGDAQDIRPDGGDGGSAIVVFAKGIKGSGQISARGQNGVVGSGVVGATTTDGSDGNAGVFKGTALAAGNKGYVDNEGARSAIVQDPLFLLFDEVENLLTDGQGSGGGGGHTDSDTGDYMGGNGGGGGGGFWGRGGQGGDKAGLAVTVEGFGGGGGGGGALAMVLSFNPMPPLWVNAQGGRGGAGYKFGGGGGGGGGGIALAIAPGFHANFVLTASGGAQGSSPGGGSTTPGTSGHQGIAVSMSVHPEEVFSI